MVHLANPTALAIMIFYSFLTFFVGPMVSELFLFEQNDKSVGGFLLGFTVSVLLWMKYGRKMALQK
jgi:positive regulator of sigma E activity